MGQLYSIREIAKETGMSRDTIYRRLKDKQWPFYLLSEKCIRIDLDEIKELFRQERETSKK